jgi:rubrerythrin
MMADALWPWSYDTIDEEGAYYQCKACGTIVIAPPPDACPECPIEVDVYMLDAIGGQS